MTGGLSVRGLTAGYGTQTIVHDLDVEVAPGEVVALMGRNGAGKSTTLMAIAGYLAHTRGTVTVAGRPMSGSAHRRARGGLGIVLEGRSVFPSLTVRRNLEVGRARVDEAVTWFPELVRMLDRPASSLSGGEQQMVALARALSRSPAVLLADELSFGLAPTVCARLLDLLQLVARERSMAIMVVEQHLELAVSVASRALIMSRGTISLELECRELLARADEIEELYLGGPASA